MKAVKGLICLWLCLFGADTGAQELRHEATAVNIEVPVRVYRGSTFIEGLTLKDFELYENGELQKIEAVFLIKKISIEHKDIATDNPDIAQKRPPRVSRNFVLVFELSQYLPKISEAIDYFFGNVLQQGDTLKVVTPLRTYDFKKDLFNGLSAQEMARQLKKKVRADTLAGNMEHRRLMRELLEENHPREYRDSLYRRLRDFKKIEEKGLAQFADYLKGEEGQKHVFLFYQKEVIPVPNGGANEDFNWLEYLRTPDFDINRIKQAFSDSSISLQFIYITKTPDYDDSSQSRSLRMRGLRMEDQSVNIFSAFREMAFATGGIVDASFNAAASFQKAVEASENYYLLYYSPKKFTNNGKFQRIEVKVKGKNYRVTHRAGYFAN